MTDFEKEWQKWLKKNEKKNLNILKSDGVKVVK